MKVLSVKIDAFPNDTGMPTIRSLSTLNVSQQNEGSLAEI